MLGLFETTEFYQAHIVLPNALNIIHFHIYFALSNNIIYMNTYSPFQFWAFVDRLISEGALPEISCGPHEHIQQGLENQQ